MFIRKRYVLLEKVKAPMKNYFNLLNTDVNTRNKGILARLPRVKLEYGRRSVRFMGAKIFNELPISMRSNFKKDHFKSILNRYF